MGKDEVKNEKIGLVFTQEFSWAFLRYFLYLYLHPPYAVCVGACEGFGRKRRRVDRAG